MSIGLLWAISVTYAMISQTTDEKLKAFDSLMLSSKSKFRLYISKIYLILMVVFEFIVQLVFWPCIFINVIIVIVESKLHQNKSKASIQARINNTRHIFSVGILLSISILLAINTNHISQYFYLWIYTFLIGVFTRYLLQFISKISIQKSIRLSKRNVFLSFGIILISDLFSTVLVIYGLTYLKIDFVFEIQNVINLTQQILFFRKIDILTKLNNLETILVYVSGTLFYATIFKNALSFKYFIRTDNDYITLANYYNSINNYSKALKILKKVKLPNEYSLGESTVAYIGLKQFESATTCAKQANVLTKESLPGTKGIEVVAFFLAQKEFSTKTIVFTLKKLIESEIADIWLALSLENINLKYRNAYNNFYDFVNQDKLLDKYPFTYSFYLLNNSNFEKLMPILQRTKTNSSIEIIIKSILINFNNLASVLNEYKLNLHDEYKLINILKKADDKINDCLYDINNIYNKLFPTLDSNFEKFVVLIFILRMKYFVNFFENIDGFDYEFDKYIDQMRSIMDKESIFKLAFENFQENLESIIKVQNQKFEET